MLLRVRIRESLSASLLEAPPTVNTSDQDDNKPQSSTECNDQKERKNCKNEKEK